MALMPVGLFSIFEKNSEMLVKVPQMQRRRDTKCGILHVFLCNCCKDFIPNLSTIFHPKLSSAVWNMTLFFSLQLLQHYEKDCPMTITPCPYAQMGCATKVSCFLAELRVTSFILKGFIYSINICRFFCFFFCFLRKNLPCCSICTSRCIIGHFIVVGLVS